MLRTRAGRTHRRFEAPARWDWPGIGGCGRGASPRGGGRRGGRFRQGL